MYFERNSKTRESQVSRQPIPRIECSNDRLALSMLDEHKYD